MISIFITVELVESLRRINCAVLTTDRDKHSFIRFFFVSVDTHSSCSCATARQFFFSLRNLLKIVWNQNDHYNYTIAFYLFVSSFSIFLCLKWNSMHLMKMCLQTRNKKKILIIIMRRTKSWSMINEISCAIFVSNKPENSAAEINAAPWTSSLNVRFQSWYNNNNNRRRKKRNLSRYILWSVYDVLVCNFCFLFDVFFWGNRKGFNLTDTQRTIQA